MWARAHGGGLGPIVGFEATEHEKDLVLFKVLFQPLPRPLAKIIQGMSRSVESRSVEHSKVERF